MTRQEKAAALHDGHYNCAQCVAAACADLSGVDESFIKAATAGFGGGMRCGEVCGAVSGAVMTLGLVCPYSDPADTPASERVTALTRRFMREFREKYGSVVCRELLAKSRVRRCPEYIASAVEMAEQIIEEEKKEKN